MCHWIIVVDWIWGWTETPQTTYIPHPLPSYANITDGTATCGLVENCKTFLCFPSARSYFGFCISHTGASCRMIYLWKSNYVTRNFLNEKVHIFLSLRKTCLLPSQATSSLWLDVASWQWLKVFCSYSKHMYDNDATGEVTVVEEESETTRTEAWTTNSPFFFARCAKLPQRNYPSSIPRRFQVPICRSRT